MNTSLHSWPNFVGCMLLHALTFQFTFNLLIAEQPSYLRELLQLHRPSLSLRSSNHNLLNSEHSTTMHCICTAEFFHAAPCVWNSLPHTITNDLNQFLNPDIKHSSTEGPISNHSVTLTAPAICLIGRHTACF